jgi:hypothetical protein
MEYRPEDVGKCLEKMKRAFEEREKGTKLAKIAYGPFGMFTSERRLLKNFAVYEIDSVEELDNLIAFYLPEITFKLIPIEDLPKLGEIWLKMQK